MKPGSEKMHRNQNRIATASISSQAIIYPVSIHSGNMNNSRQL